VAHRILTG